MVEYQERVIAEKKALDDKRYALQTFVGGTKFLSLENQERKRMRRQTILMELYSEVLAERINAF